MVKGDPEVQEKGSDEYMVVWRDTDVSGGDGDEHYLHEDLKRDLSRRESCTADQLLFNRDEDHPIYQSLKGRGVQDSSLWSMSPRALFGRQIDGTMSGNGAGVNLASTIGSTAGCPTTRKVALIGVATDCTYTAKFNSSQTLREHVIAQVNLASQLYESTFNISLGIQNLTISNAACPAVATAQAPWNVDCSATLPDESRPGQSRQVTITDRLNLFSHWRGQFIDNNAYWMLLSTCPTEGAVGLAWLGQVCVQGAVDNKVEGKNETIASANVVVWTSTEWQVIAHETGHTFGAVHDCVAQTCADGTFTRQACCPLTADTCNANSDYIMNPSTGVNINQFSPCSVGNICSAMGRNSIKTSCLSNNRDVSTISGSQCGNGIVESGEDCDCGGVEGCGANPCCDPKTCKFKPNAFCDPANEECCTPTCGFAANGTVCRTSSGTCDPQETCTGTSAMCPVDLNAPDGTECGASGAGLQCASGQCTSRDLQCRAFMGKITTNNDTYACNDEACQLSCASPEFGPRVCYTSSQNFLDGTECQGGGRCSNGVCKGSNFGDTVLGWIKRNPAIFYPVVIVVGILIISVIVSICVGCCRRSKRRRQAKPVMSPPGMVQYGGPRQGGPQPPPPGMGQWAPGPPPGAYHQPPPGQSGEHQQWGVQRAFSATRYA